MKQLSFVVTEHDYLKVSGGELDINVFLFLSLQC